MIIYPHLLKNDVIHLVSENEINFWKNLLERVSIGESPFYTELKNNYLYYGDKFIFLPDSTEKDVVQFFKDVVGVQLNFVSYLSWKDIKKKVTRDDLIHMYVSEKQKEFDLSSKEQSMLLYFINLNINLKLITTENIVLEIDKHTFIKEIDNLVIERNVHNEIVFDIKR